MLLTFPDGKILPLATWQDKWQALPETVSLNISPVIISLISSLSDGFTDLATSVPQAVLQSLGFPNLTAAERPVCGYNGTCSRSREFKYLNVMSVELIISVANIILKSSSLASQGAIRSFPPTTLQRIRMLPFKFLDMPLKGSPHLLLLIYY